MLSQNKDKLWQKIESRSRAVEREMHQLQRKRTGSYYTGIGLTDVMMHELVSHIVNNGKNICECRFLEPCVGVGNFVFSYLKCTDELKLSRIEQTKILNNIYVADVNETALEEYKGLLTDFAMVYWDISLDDEYFTKHIGTGLLIDVTKEKLEYIPLEKVFPECDSEKRFDIVVTNPPYKNLKAERGHYETDDEYDNDKAKYGSIAQIVSKHFSYSTDGVLNLYKLFVEEIIDHYGNEDAYISLLIPASILSDKTCEKLRTHILKDECLLSVKAVGEGSGYIDAQQALCAILLKKSEKTSMVEICKDFVRNPKSVAQVSISDIINNSTGNAIIAVDEEEYERLKKMRVFPTIKELHFITNLRGELDLTANKKSIVSENTGYPLLRGRNVGYYKLVESNEHDFVSAEFVNSTKKNCYIMKDRIICQQIANMHKERRVTFALAPKNSVLGNSCNFISVEPNLYGIDIYSILGLLNTKIINWFFKLTSSNNHINNYEIDSFPIPIGSEELTKIALLAKNYLELQNDKLLDEIERCAELAYGIRNEDKMDNEILLDEFYADLKMVYPNATKEIAQKLIRNESDVEVSANDKFTQSVIDSLVLKYQKINNSEVLNHVTFKLSDLDLEMIKAVPPGGSWKDIPLETVEKSKRLKRISETGGRTTLYGRIDYDKPSYTITTYFNRPGNGTYVHPVHERVLSVREAARFQCFPDDYYFYGNKTQLLKQVGNAVPTLLAYQIACNIVEKVGCRKSVDLFCGAGGMTVGFKKAGIESMLSNDIEESACITLKINNPEINVLCGDITKAETKDKIVETAKKCRVDLICGGPPCQGFSMAGLRLTDDPRNQLFKEFVDVVSRINPKVVVFENVEGLLSYQGGKTYKAIHQLFSEIGYKTEGRTLMTNEYAVPQKRKRVIIICVRKDINVEPSELYPKQITLKPEQQVTARDTIADLENVECSENALYDVPPHSDIVKLFRGYITYSDYLKKYVHEEDEDKVLFDKSAFVETDGQMCLNLTWA